MRAIKINKDRNVEEIDIPVEEWRTPDISWSAVPFDQTHDIYYNDEGGFEAGAAYADIGPIRRVILPAYILGSDGERDAPATLPIDLAESVVI